MQKTNQKELGLKRWLKEKVIKYMSNGKVILLYLVVGLIKKIQCDSNV